MKRAFFECPKKAKRKVVGRHLPAENMGIFCVVFAFVGEMMYALA